jgi:hypothetical protein
MKFDAKEVNTMKKSSEKHTIIPVRFNSADLDRLQREADAMRLSIAAVVRLKVAKVLAAEESVPQA